MRSVRRTAVALTVAGPLLLAGCGHQASDALPQPDAKKAAAELQTGLTAQGKGDLDTAAQHYQEALKYDQKNKYALYDLALIDAARANYGEAEKKYQVVLGIDPAYAPALFNLAILLKDQGKTAEATSLYHRLLTVDPKNASAHMNLGLLLRQSGQQAEGDAEVKQAIALNPQLKDPAGVTQPPPSPFRAAGRGFAGCGHAAGPAADRDHRIGSAASWAPRRRRPGSAMAAVAAVVLVTAGLTYAVVSTRQDLTRTARTLSATRTDLADAQNELSATRTTLAAARDQIGSIKSQLGGRP